MFVLLARVVAAFVQRQPRVGIAVEQAFHGVGHMYEQVQHGSILWRVLGHADGRRSSVALGKQRSGGRGVVGNRSDGRYGNQGRQRQKRAQALR